MKKLVILLAIALVAIPLVQAASFALPPQPPQREDYTVKPTDEPLHLILEQYTKTGLKLYEKSRVIFEFQGNRLDLLVNSIGKDTKLTLVHPDDKTETLILPLGEKSKEVRIVGSEKLPSFFIESEILYSSDNAEERYAILVVTVPVIQKWTPNNKPPASNDSNTADATTISTEEKKGDLFFKISAIIIALLVLVLIFLGPKKKSDKNPV